MTPSNIVAGLAFGLMPSLSNADLLDAISVALNELDGRGDQVDLRKGSIMSRWAEISLREDGYRTVFHDTSIAEQASAPVGGAA